MKDLVAKILSPSCPVEYNGQTYWVRQNIPFKLSLKAGLVRENIMRRFRFSGMLRRDSVMGILGNPPMEELEKQLQDLKLKLYQKYPDSFLTKNSRSSIKATTQEINDWYAQYSALDSVTLEGYADKHTSIFIISKLSKTTLDVAIELQPRILRSAISISQIRKIARSDYWQNIYAAKNPFRILPLTDEQIALSTYTKLYQNINKHPEPPTQDIIDDDDLLDGWLISESRKRSQKKTTFGSKIDGAKEIFVMAQNQDHANEIYSGNSDEARAIQNVRMRQLKQQGSVPFGKLADVQRNLHAQR